MFDEPRTSQQLSDDGGGLGTLVALGVGQQGEGGDARDDDVGNAERADGDQTVKQGARLEGIVAGVRLGDCGHRGQGNRAGLSKGRRA